MGKIKNVVLRSRYQKEGRSSIYSRALGDESELKRNFITGIGLYVT